MKILRSLTFKFTLAFLLVGLTGAVLVAVIVQGQTRTAFDQFIVSREHQIQINRLVHYYQAQGGWEGIANYLSNPPVYPQSDNNLPWDGRKNGEGYTLIDSNWEILYSSQPVKNGQSVSSRDINRAYPIQADGKTIGWLLLTPERREWSPGSPENNFIQNVNHATLVSALVAVSLALIMGVLLAFTMTRSLRELINAMVEIAQGKLGRQVKIRSKDELGELAASFNRMSLDLARANQARRQMTADVAHDLRSPLSVIAGYVEALSEGKLPGNSEVYGILSQETKHLSHLVEDLRLLSLADAGELPLSIQTVSPRSILEHVALRYSVAAQQKGIMLRVQAVENISPVAVDVERMAQVLDNLVSNAFRYTPAAGEIILSARQQNGFVQMQVQDSGSGIPAEDIPHIFDRFYKGDKSRHRSEESGLGLAIVKSIIEAQGGSIAVESTPGKGAVFTIRLAAAQYQS